jgi:hypothetical protein
MVCSPEHTNVTCFYDHAGEDSDGETLPYLFYVMRNMRAALQSLAVRSWAPPWSVLSTKWGRIWRAIKGLADAVYLVGCDADLEDILQRALNQLALEIKAHLESVQLTRDKLFRLTGDPPIAETAPSAWREGAASAALFHRTLCITLS